MEIYNCDYCLEFFSEETHKPILLDCGHTFCIVCLKRFLTLEKICMRCIKPLEKTLEEYPTNSRMLEQIALETQRYFKSSIRTKLKNYENECLRRNEVLRESITIRTTLKSTIIKCIVRLQELLRKKETSFDSSEAERLMNELDVDIETVDAVLYCRCTKNVKSTFALTDFASVSFFLPELVNRLKKEERFYAYTMVHSKPKYGKITLNADRINIHAFDLTSVDKNASLISLQDLKNCIGKSNFRTFIQYLDQTLYFTITDSSLSLSILRFIKLCSGEDGPMIKGSFTITPEAGNQLAIDHKEYVRIEKYNYTEKENECITDYDIQLFSEVSNMLYNDKTNNIIVKMSKDGSCEIIKLLRDIETIDNVVAEMTGVRGIKLRTSEPVEINDSGISILL